MIELAYPVCDSLLAILRCAWRDGCNRILSGSRTSPPSSYGRCWMANNRRQVKLYIAEEQQILREAYQSFFLSHPDIEVVGASSDTNGESVVKAVTALSPAVVLLGVKTLQAAAVEKLDMLRESCPDVAIVLLSAYYDLKGIKALREFSRGAAVGCAYLLKHTIDTVEQLTQVILSVSQGRIILDQAVMEGLMSSTDTKSTMLKELSPRELEVLSWMAKGYRNDTIAEVLGLEPKTVERHINNIYGKLGDRMGSRHARVHAVMLYLKATGLLPDGFSADDQN